MSKNALAPIKSLGQNFLNDDISINLLLKNLEIDPTDHIFEIGGGTGNITKRFVQRFNYEKYDIFEIDERCIPILKDIARKKPNTEVISENVLDYDFTNFDSKTKVFGAIPYYITSPLLHTFIELENSPDLMIFIVQKEFADKILEVAPRANFWTYFTHGYEKTRLTNISRELFKPVPKVDSTIIMLKKDNAIDAEIRKIGYKKWKGFLHLVFNKPRKMINKTFSHDILDAAGISGSLRPQDLTFVDMLKLYEIKYDTNYR